MSGFNIAAVSIPFPLLVDLQKEPAMQHSFQVQGMTCGHCERAVVHAVRSVDTDATVQVDLPTGRVVVESDQPREALAAAITEEGYTVAA
jgi:copper chaperone